MYRDPDNTSPDLPSTFFSVILSYFTITILGFEISWIIAALMLLIGYMCYTIINIKINSEFRLTVSDVFIPGVSIVVPLVNVVVIWYYIIVISLDYICPALEKLGRVEIYRNKSK